jgi:hypothetical protein
MLPRLLNERRHPIEQPLEELLVPVADDAEDVVPIL